MAIIVLVFSILLYCIWCCIWGLATNSIGESKGYKHCFWWGFFLGLLGLIVVACLSDNKLKNNSSENIEALDKLQKLKESGAISEQEFETSKKKLLSKL